MKIYSGRLFPTIMKAGALGELGGLEELGRWKPRSFDWDLKLLSNNT